MSVRRRSPGEGGWGDVDELFAKQRAAPARSFLRLFDATDPFSLLLSTHKTHLNTMKPTTPKQQVSGGVGASKKTSFAAQSRSPSQPREAVRPAVIGSFRRPTPFSLLLLPPLTTHHKPTTTSPS